MTLRTVGHGTLPEEDFTALVSGAGIGVVVDVRSFPASRRHPQFRREAMERWLPDAGVAYRWESRLGGRRRPRPDSPHGALRGAAVEHLFHDGRLDPHRPTPEARFDGRRLVYDGGEPGLPLRES